MFVSTKNIAVKYSGTTIGTQYFVPPSRNPDILPDTPSGVSGSPKLTKITDGVVSLMTLVIILELKIIWI